MPEPEPKPEPREISIKLLCPSVNQVTQVVAWADQKIDLGFISRAFGLDPSTLRLNGYFISRGVDLVASSLTWKSLLSFFSSKGLASGEDHRHPLLVTGNFCKLAHKSVEEEASGLLISPPSLEHRRKASKKKSKKRPRPESPVQMEDEGPSNVAVLGPSQLAQEDEGPVNLLTAIGFFGPGFDPVAVLDLSALSQANQELLARARAEDAMAAFTEMHARIWAIAQFWGKSKTEADEKMSILQRQVASLQATLKSTYNSKMKIAEELKLMKVRIQSLEEKEAGWGRQVEEAEQEVASLVTAMEHAKLERQKVETERLAKEEALALVEEAKEAIIEQYTIGFQKAVDQARFLGLDVSPMDADKDIINGQLVSMLKEQSTSARSATPTASGAEEIIPC